MAQIVLREQCFLFSIQNLAIEIKSDPAQAKEMRDFLPKIIRNYAMKK
jgi:hypothetical protein